MKFRPFRNWMRVAGVLVMVILSGCAATVSPDPTDTLNSTESTRRQHLAAIDAISQQPQTESSVAALQRAITQPGYSLDVREEAIYELERVDREALMRMLRQHLPRTTSWGWLIRQCEIIEKRGWTELTPALVSSWARPTGLIQSDLERPEYLALKGLHGEDRVTDIVFETMMSATGAGQQGLRTRCWDLLHRLGERQRLVNLLASSDVPSDDAMLIDLRAAAVELGIVPHTREEVLWLRKLREPQRAEFWSRAVTAVQALDADRRVELELRDLPIIVSASLHEPELLERTAKDLYASVDSYVCTQKHHAHESNYDHFNSGANQRLHGFADKLTWGDLAALRMAIRAVGVPEVVDHLFDYAERDRADETTEYGGIITLDAKDRFEVLEFPPIMRHHDNKFIASQEMLDAAYTSLFHFHFHVQNERSVRFAGPGFGDINYAENTRANCLVFTSVNKDTLNVDFYRHDRVIVDLGEIKRR